MKAVFSNKSLIWSIIVSTCALIIFSAFIYYIGTRMTMARSHFIHGYRFYQDGNCDKANEYLKKSLAEWDNHDSRFYLNECIILQK